MSNILNAKYHKKYTPDKSTVISTTIKCETESGDLIWASGDDQELKDRLTELNIEIQPADSES